MLIITGGSFGQDVAARITRRHRATIVAADDAPAPTPDLLAGHDMLLFATWRPYVRLARQIDNLCHQLGLPWALAEVSGSTLTCGPVIVPGSGAGCYHCLLARTDAHQRTGDRTLVLRQAYAADPRLGPAGHSGPMAAMAAAALMDAAEQMAAGAAADGAFRKVDLLTGTVLETALIPLHDCPRCRELPQGHAATGRFIDTMVPALERILMP